MSSSSLKSYAKGSKCPPTKPGLLRLYNMRFCPYAQRPKLVMIAKNIKFEEININLTQKPEWFFEKDPLGLVPNIEFDEKVIGESLVICDYLEDAYPEINLHPKDAYLKAKNSMLIARFSKFTSALYKMLTSKDVSVNVLWEEAQNTIDYIEKELNSRGTKFLFGEKPGMVDYMIWPWFERLSAWYLMVDIETLSTKRFPKLTSYIAEMWKDPTVLQVAHKPEIMKHFTESKLKTPMPDYDVGLE